MKNKSRAWVALACACASCILASCRSACCCDFCPPRTRLSLLPMILVAAKGAISALRSRCRTVHQLQVIRLCTRRTHTNGLPKQLRVVVSKQRSSSLYSTNVTRSWPTQLQAIRPLQAEANSHPSELFRAADSNDLQKASTKPRIMLIGWLGAQKIHLDKCVVFWKTCSRACCHTPSYLCTVPRHMPE
jgi:hypothetical protein